MDRVSLLGFLLFPYILSRLRYRTLFQLALLWLSSTQSYQGISYGWYLFLCVLSLYCYVNFLTSLFVLSGYIPSSAPDTVLLVVLEHPTTFGE